MCYEHGIVFNLHKLEGSEFIVERRLRSTFARELDHHLLEKSEAAGVNQSAIPWIEKVT